MSDPTAWIVPWMVLLFFGGNFLVGALDGAMLSLTQTRIVRRDESPGEFWFSLLIAGIGTAAIMIWALSATFEWATR